MPLEEAFAIYSARQVSGLKTGLGSETTADAPDTWGSVKRQAAFVERYAVKRLMGFEPTTFCMASRRSSQLSYSRALAGG